MASYLVSMKTNVVRLFFEDPLFTEFYRDFVSIPFPEWDCLREFVSDFTDLKEKKRFYGRQLLVFARRLSIDFRFRVFT